LVKDIGPPWDAQGRDGEEYGEGELNDAKSKNGGSRTQQRIGNLGALGEEDAAKDYG
jgi:hypothetical protein